MGLRSDLYKSARILGDLSAASKGPTVFGKRIVRKSVYRRTNRATSKVLRKFGLF